MTEAQAQKRGYKVTRGAYVGTSDDRADRWYIERIDSGVVDRRGFGFATKVGALAYLEEELALGLGEDE